MTSSGPRMGLGQVSRPPPSHLYHAAFTFSPQYVQTEITGDQLLERRLTPHTHSTAKQQGSCQITDVKIIPHKVVGVLSSIANVFCKQSTACINNCLTQTACIVKIPEVEHTVVAAWPGHGARVS